MEFRVIQIEPRYEIILSEEERHFLEALIRAELEDGNLGHASEKDAEAFCNFLNDLLEMIKAPALQRRRNVMQAVEFPVFRSEAPVYCMQCGSDIGEACDGVDNGYPPGRGQYGIRCNHCGATTFFDIRTDEPLAGGPEYHRWKKERGLR